MKIHTKPDTKPYCCKKPTMVPLHYREQIRADLEADVKKVVLEVFQLAYLSRGVPEWLSSQRRMAKQGVRWTYHT
jgi:hypothetical protein